jgi:NAD+ synthase
MRELDYNKLGNSITNWINDYANKANIDVLVVGVSGGIDSAVVSTLAAKTGKRTILLEMPIHQDPYQVTRAKEHINWLESSYSNVESYQVDLTETYDQMVNTLSTQIDFNRDHDRKMLTLANTRSRLRMVTLYSYSNMYGGLVVGTGNKVEDFGVGFFTLGGDGQVDISPIADLMKSEVYKLGASLGVIKDILEARPTDGLWDDGRTDEDQIGATYDELEWAMDFVRDNTRIEQGIRPFLDYKEDDLSEREREVLAIYLDRHNKNKHKMISIPVFRVTQDLMNYEEA